MFIDFKKGYSIYIKKPEDLVIAAPHSGPSINSPIARDDHSDTLASYLWNEVGGKLVLSNISRNRLFGVDLNRDIPALKIALENYKIFELGIDLEKIDAYMKKYAFVAYSEEDYERRLRIYQNFWSEIENGRIIVLIHRAFNRLKTAPSIMDIIIFGENKNLRSYVTEAISKLNSKYYKFLQFIENDYKQAIIAETKRFILDIMFSYNSFNLNNIGIIKRKAIELDIEKMKKYASPVLVEDLRRNFTPQNFIKITENALSRMGLPQITLESVHDGSLAHGPKRKLFPSEKIVIEIESTQFLSFWHPQIGSKILRDLIEELKNL
ncbi:hypothetical protein HY498_05650 [Candidatus Woesearchaeota archaeon]|nr:hypothetical protein [Candidatus Woesearchaeota archaeon]